ncbi:MAG: hypothetical protein ACPIOQ_02795, partial [Promethearchaeia archaeon]
VEEMAIGACEEGFDHGQLDSKGGRQNLVADGSELQRPPHAEDACPQGVVAHKHHPVSRYYGCEDIAVRGP